MKKLKPYFYWANHPCTKEVSGGRGILVRRVNCGVGNPQLQSRRSLSSKAGEVNMKDFAQELTANLPRKCRIVEKAASLVRRLSSLTLNSFNLGPQVSHFTVLVVSLTFQTNVRTGLWRCFPE